MCPTNQFKRLPPAVVLAAAVLLSGNSITAFAADGSSIKNNPATKTNKPASKNNHSAQQTKKTGGNAQKGIAPATSSTDATKSADQKDLLNDAEMQKTEKELNDALGPISPPPLPPEPTIEHNASSTFDIGPVKVGPLIQIASLRPIRLDASYSQPITLREALVYTVDNSLPIKISKETWLSQLYLFGSAMGGFLPNENMTWSLVHTEVYPHTSSFSRNYSNTISQPVFQGGQVLYTALSQYYREKGWHNAYRGTINDTLLDVYNRYTNLLLQRALLQIRIKSMETSEAQLRLNEQLYNAGTGTRFAVMQSRTQLALDRQALLLEQVAVRQAGLSLAFALNMPLAGNLVPSEQNVAEASLVDEKLNINDLLNAALVYRPELRQYENWKLAAARRVQIQASQYYPTITLQNTFSHSSTSIHSHPSAAAANTQTANPVAGAINTTSATAASAASTINANQNSSTLTTPTTGSLASIGAGVVGSRPTNSMAYQFLSNESLPGMGYTTFENIIATRDLARQTYMQSNQELILVTEQIRSSYLNALTARQQIDVTAAAVASSGEALRLANLRVQTGVGTNLELIQAQRDYITALVNQAQAIISSNLAQAQLLHDTGLISIESLTTGYKPRIGALQGPY